ncbi:uridine kinase [Dactylosporangium matsuzakiense]|uniref:Uridine kinase n=1 Tax=Dactylosporangium matsuzakiense TaxID=53360 RepID=A0A9W6KUD9_9ACTN|nr:uridine kinase [Dactylosporangium matsuzakiense]UWZ49019.1 uridine kinase [Dactylosporangium matsuzakiense]GLL07417.1 uridine kinase [Dactylosporangium matsuzakiense]
MKASPVTVAALARQIAARVTAFGGGHPARVAVDGAPTAGAADLAEAAAGVLRDEGVPALHIAAGMFLRAASLRLERGRTNPDAYYEDWLDLRALTREVLGPAGPGGTGRVLPSLWDPVTDRATRAAYVTVPAHGAVIVSGVFLLGAGLGFDVAVHLMQSDAALTRRLPAELGWTVPAYGRYRDEVMPEYQADVVVRADDPRHPAVVTAL